MLAVHLFLYKVLFFFACHMSKFLTKWQKQTVQIQMKENLVSTLSVLRNNCKKKNAEFMPKKVWNKVFKILGHLP